MEIGALGPEREEPRLAPTRGRSHPRRRRASRPRTPPRFFLATTGCFVSDEEVCADGVLVQLMADDLVWCVAVEDWQRRRPRWWRWRPLQAWRAEYDTLAFEQARIARTARFYGVPD